MKKVRTPDEIQLEITRLEWKLRELREELHISDAVNNPNYQEILMTTQMGSSRISQDI